MQSTARHMVLALARSPPRAVAATGTAPYLVAVQRRWMRLPKHVQAAVDANPDLRSVVDEFSLPGKYHHYFFKSKRQVKREEKLERFNELAAFPEMDMTNPAAPSRNRSQQYDDSRPPSKRMAQRVSRAIHDILYDPTFGVGGDGEQAWRVDRVDVTVAGTVTVWWVPNEDVGAMLMLDNDYMVGELEAMAKTVKSALRAKLKLRKNEVPKIVFMRRDTSLDLLLDIVAEEAEIEGEVAVAATTEEPVKADEVDAAPRPARESKKSLPVIDLFAPAPPTTTSAKRAN
ncbi:hypothetical protein H9P43_005885 [Blastocladiella emersonii ATCC 22665]|nr:hypothetical protein H9P43_005885 [Blastocladiella emersonii ATCC 22665]